MTTTGLVILLIAILLVVLLENQLVFGPATGEIKR